MFDFIKGNVPQMFFVNSSVQHDVMIVLNLGINFTIFFCIKNEFDKSKA